jgi:hypothetical protein
MRKQGRTLEGVIRGDLPLAQYIFRDGRKRRLIKPLQEEGWPIFDLAGRRCAFPADLDVAMREAVNIRPKPAPRRASKAPQAELEA